MNTPEWVQIWINVVAFVALFLVVPQVVGVLLLRRWWNRGWKLRIALALSPAVLCFFVSIAYWNVTAARIAAAGGYPCGLLGMAASWTTLMGSLLNVVVGFVVLLMLTLRRRRMNSGRREAAC